MYTVSLKEQGKYPVKQVGVVKPFELTLGIFTKYDGLRFGAVIVNGKQHVVGASLKLDTVEKLALYLAAFLVGEQYGYVKIAHTAGLRLVVAAENINDLMLYKLLDGGAGGL